MSNYDTYADLLLRISVIIEKDSHKKPKKRMIISQSAERINIFKCEWIRLWSLQYQEGLDVNS
jgi:hypothetical protein